MQGFCCTTTGSKKILCTTVQDIQNMASSSLLISFSHLVNGSPIKPLGQLQIGLWFTTLHRAPYPQVPGHGSMHFMWRQALFKGHSE